MHAIPENLGIVSSHWLQRWLLSRERCEIHLLGIDCIHHYWEVFDWVIWPLNIQNCCNMKSFEGYSNWCQDLGKRLKDIKRKILRGKRKRWAIHCEVDSMRQFTDKTMSKNMRREKQISMAEASLMTKTKMWREGIRLLHKLKLQLGKSMYHLKALMPQSILFNSWKHTALPYLQTKRSWISAITINWKFM